MFSGVIPINITSLKYLQYIDISNDKLSGTLPSHLSNLKSFTHSPASGQDRGIFGRYNPGSVSAITKGQILTYRSIDRILDMNMVSIDLSSNNLSGPIPEEIATLDALVNLNLLRNHFSGSVPDKIGGMQSLESIDFSRNNLFGDIPAGLSNLTFLSYLDHTTTILQEEYHQRHNLTPSMLKIHQCIVAISVCVGHLFKRIVRVPIRQSKVI